MAWTERQRRLLGAIGVRLWTPAGDPSLPPGPVATTGPSAARVAPLAPAVPVAPTAAAEASDAPAPAPHVPARVARPVPRPIAPPADVPVPVPVAAPRPALDGAVAALDWATLQQAVTACTSCALSGSRQRAVFGVGHAAAHWMIVGEAPGEHEDEAGEPFVGPAGQLLDQMLASLGLSRRGPEEGDADAARQVFIANALRCRPPRNRNPSAEELAQCEPFLRRQVELVRPRVLLAMGRFAVKLLVGSDEVVGKLRGRLHDYDGVPVVVTYPPAYLLRNPGDKARAWEDLCLAADVAASGD